MSHQEKLSIYEREKLYIQLPSKSAKEYEDRIKALCKKLKLHEEKNYANY